MKYLLMDASAFIYAVDKGWKTKQDFLVEQSLGQAFLYIPQFCVTEVFNTYARFFYRDKKIGTQVYEKWKKSFKDLIQNRNTIYCYDLHRYHNLNADEVYKHEHTIPYGYYHDRKGKRRRRGALSSLDILIIAMGMELKKIHAPNDVTILSRDKRLIKISNTDNQFAPAIWFE